MAVELVGKRCLCVSGGERLEPAGVSRWSWRAGVIRACDSPALTVCVHWDGEQSAERKWRRLREECEVVLLEQELVWATKRTGTNGSGQEKRRLQPALRFRPLIGQSCIGGWTVVEFISDRQLEFYTEQEELQPFEDEVDGGNPAVRDDPSLQEQVQAWLKQNQFQNILQKGACSLKGLRVKVFRLESKAQWLSGVITHHGQNNRTVAVMTDQVREMNVDTSLVQMMVLDDITHSSLMGDNSKRKAHITKINRIFLGTGSISNNTTNDQVCSSRPVQQQSEMSTQNCSMEEDEKEGMRVEKRSDEARDSSKSKNSNVERKRRKEDEEQDDKQRNRCGLKRLKAGSVSDLSENSDSENSSCRVQDSSSDSGSKRQLKQRYTSSKRPLDCEVHPSHRGGEPSPNQLGESKTQKTGKTSPSVSPSASFNGAFRNTDALESGALVTGGKSEEKGDGGMTEIEDRSEGASREDSEAVSALLASQESEQLVSMEATCVLLHASPLECEGAEAEHEMSTNDSEVKGSEFTHAEPRGSELNQSEVRRSEFPHSEASSDNAVPVKEEPRGPPPCSPVIPCNKEEDVDSKPSCSPATVNAEYGPVTSLEATHKPSVPTSPCSSPEIIFKPQTVRETSRQKQSASLEIGLLKDAAPLAKSMDRTLSGLKMAPNPKVTCSTTPVLIQTPSPTPNRSRTPTHSPSRTLNRTPTPDKSNKSPLIVGRKEPFTIYRDPALIRTELEAHPTYIQPPHMPPNPKHHLKTPSPSSSSPSLTPASSHSKLLSPSPHPAHLSPIPLHSQPPLCSLSTPHSTIPHPHLLPSLLPPALLSGHPRIGALGLPHHPLALPGNLSLLGQTSGAAPLAPLGLYPLLWPPFPNGAHSYPGLGLQASKWTHPDGAGISDSSVRSNTPSPWISQPTTVTNADGQGLQPPLPIRPSSADPQRVSRNTQHCTPSSKTTEELDRRAVTESTLIYTHLKSEQERLRTAAGKNGQTYCPVALESSPSRTKQPLVYDLTGERPNRYQEENRRILQESSEVAPFTAKLCSDREPRYPRNPTSAKEREREMDRDRDGERERDVHAFRHILPPRPQSAHPTPTLTPSSYYASLSNSVENKPQQRRVPASKELYERLSASNTVAPVLTSSSSQVSMRARPPPLVKHHHEKEEGLLGKISEQLAHKASSMEAVEVAAVERRGPGSSLISVSSSPRNVPLLHRAPIFHPPAPTIVVSKDSGHGRLSPPTLTPIQPMSLPGKAQKQQRPPTLLPELKHVALDGKRLVPEKETMPLQAYDTQWGGVMYGREKLGGRHTTNGGVVKPQSATASVIVRPTNHTHTTISYTVSDSSVSQMQCGHIRPLEIWSNPHSKESGVQQKRGVLWTPLDTVHPINLTAQKGDFNAPINMTTKPINTAQPLTNMNVARSRIDLIAEHCKRREIGAVQPKMESSLTSFCTSRDFPHLKKHRAGLAIAESRHNTRTIQPQHTTHLSNAMKHTSHLSNSRCGSCTTLTTQPVCSAHASGREKEPVFNTSSSECLRLPSGTSSPVPTTKQGLLTNELAPASAVTNQSRSGQNSYHKLKKAWLTRHSEQDRGSTVSQSVDGTKTAVTLTSTSNSVPIKQKVNGLVDNGFSQEDKDPSLDSRKSKILNKKTQENRKSGSNALSFNSEDKKSVIADEKPVTVGKKSSLEEVKPVLDRNGKLEGKEPLVEDKKSFEKRSTPVHMKPEREKRGEKRPLESSGDSESGGDSGNESENGGSGRRFKRQPKSSFKITQNDHQKKKVEEEEEEEEEEAKPNGTLQSAKDKPQQRLANSSGIPRSVLKDWRKVRKLKQTGEAFLQDVSCAEIGTNVQKCRECRLDRSRKSQEPAISPVFCRFYYFRRLSYSKNGVIRVNGFSVSEQTDEEAVTVWTGSSEDEEGKKMRKMDLETSKSVLALIGDKFCQLIKTEDTAFTWVKKDTQIMWKRAVRGVREMCDACEATLFNMHWACHKCGFVVCMDCYKAREKKKAKDKELYAWVRCVKNQPHDFKNLMPTQIVPETVLVDMQRSVHSMREKFGIPSHCSCTDCKTHNPSTATTNGLSPLSDTDQSDLKSRQIPDQQKNLHVTVKAHTEKREKARCDGMEAHSRKSTSPKQGSTLRDLLTSTAGKLRLGATGGAFAPVYNLSEQVAQNTRVPNILDDIIASVVENKIPATKMARVGLNQDSLPEGEVGQRPEGVKLDESPLADPHAIVPHDWLGNHRLLWLKDHRHQGNQRLFKENWTQEQPVLVSGLHKSLNANLWKPEHFSREFSSLHSDLYNCRDGSVTNSNVKEFWDGFEDVSKRPKSDKGESVVYRLKDWPSGEEFLALMPARYHDVMKSLPVPEYTDPEAHLNLASHLPSFFIRPDLGPRLCCAHGVTTCPEQDFGTSNLHVEISDSMSILVYVGVAKGNGASSKAGVLKLLEGEVLDESVKKRLKDPKETPGALWHIYTSKDLQKIQEFLQKIAAEQQAEADPEADSDSEWDGDSDPLREGSWYLSPRLRQKLQNEYGIESRTLLQFHGDAVIIPAGALHQVMNLHSCIQVNVDFVSPEHAHNSYYLTQELRPLKDQMNYEDKLQVKNIFYHSVKDAVATLRNHLKEKNTDDGKQEGS
ncbi:probable JmjC domain-containing histone demethylation protein 2C isoform X2 [Sinocyclocheilus anshuiensis]|uniref:probable JmjC domain-containing histone demethylation protein 2C isoform X2 n=1 Tax=Sinocyclocheilus anshuiensis TaxID=1608454 RepID=UPI0007BA5D27|nr:PREDICTED: probable JmjC domain-containing histone demethylation protein 2C isoform X2 [Sinocyclocheilus anshuiensis]